MAGSCGTRPTDGGTYAQTTLVLATLSGHAPDRAGGAGGGGVDASSSLRRFYLARTAEDLQSRACLAEDQIVPLLAAKKYAEIDALCKELGQRSSTRLTVILPDGKVVGDSLESPQEMDNHAARPEVVDALDEDKGKGVSLRYSQTLKQDLRYVAVPARDHGQTLGVVRAAVSLAAIDERWGDSQPHPRRPAC